MRRREFLHATIGAASLAYPAPGQRPPGPPRTGDLAAIHTVIVTPEWSADIGKHYDPARFIRLCREAQVEVIEFYAKNALGHAMFPFRGRPCPRDWVTESRKLAKEAGLKFILYYNIGLDNWMARQHPEWMCLDSAGKPLLFARTWNWMCIRSPYRDLVLDELRQIQQAVHSDGLWFDLTGAPNSYGGSLDPALACHCPWCRAAFRQRFQAEMPVATDDPKLRLSLYQFAEEARVDMLRDSMKLAQALDPGLSLSYNHVGDFWERMYVSKNFPEVERSATLGSLEAKAHSAISLRAKMLWSQGKQYQLHSYGAFQRMQPGSASGTWVDWNLIPGSYLEVSAAVTSAHAGRFTVGVNLVPDGTLFPDEFRNLSGVFAAIREREPWLAGLRSVPNVAVIYDPRSELAARLARRSMIQETTGLHDALLEASLHFDVVRDGDFEPRDYRALLIGNAVAPSAELSAKLRDFVAAGGLLVATHGTSLHNQNGERLPDFAWSDLFGVRFAGVSPFREANYGWLADELRGQALRYPVLFTSEILEVECTTAKPLATVVYPEKQRTAETFLWETLYNQFKLFTDKPLITLNPVGKGAVVYIAAPIGQEIAARGDPWLKNIIATVVKKYATALAPAVKAPPGIQVVFGRKPDSGAHVLSLVNHYAGMAVGKAGTPRPQVGPVEVSLPLSVLQRRPKSVTAIDARGVRWNVAGDALHIAIESIGVHAVLAIV